MAPKKGVLPPQFAKNAKAKAAAAKGKPLAKAKPVAKAKGKAKGKMPMVNGKPAWLSGK